MFREFFLQYQTANEDQDSKIIKEFPRGLREVRRFFVEHNYALGDADRDAIEFLEKGDTVTFYYRNNISRILVTRV